MTVERDEDEAQRALRSLHSAAYCAVDAHCTPEELLAAYEDGIAEALDRRAHRAELYATFNRTVDRMEQLLGRRFDRPAA